jgi:tetratricopeptide (TPR) repeat protein
LVGPEQARWFAELEVDHGNLLAALDHASRSAEGAPRGLRLAGAAARYWSGHGHFETGRQALTRALEADRPNPPSPARAKVLVRAGAFALVQADYAGARPLIEESLAVSRELGDAPGVTRSLSGLATVAIFEGRVEEARRYGEEALALYRAAGNKRGTAQTLHALSFVALSQGDAQAAKPLHEECVALLRALGDQESLALSLGLAASLELRLGNRAGAHAVLVEAVGLVQKLGAKREGAYVLEAAAELAEAAGDPARAAWLAGAAQAVRTDIASPLGLLEVPSREALLERARAGAGPEAFDNALADGRLRGLEEAMEALGNWLAGLKLG